MKEPQDSRSPGLNSGLAKYEAEVITTRPWRSKMPRMRDATVAYFNKITLHLTGEIQKHDSKYTCNVTLRRVPINVLRCSNHSCFFGLS